MLVIVVICVCCWCLCPFLQLLLCLSFDLFGEFPLLEVFTLALDCCPCVQTQTHLVHLVKMGQPSNLGLVPGPYSHKKVVLVVDLVPFQRTEVVLQTFFGHVVPPQAIRAVVHGCYRRKIETMAALLAGWFKKTATCFGLLSQVCFPRDVDGCKTGWRPRGRTRSWIGRTHCDDCLKAEGGRRTYSGWDGLPVFGRSELLSHGRSTKGDRAIDLDGEPSKCWLSCISFTVDGQRALLFCWHGIEDKAFRKRKCSRSDIRVQASRQTMVENISNWFLFEICQHFGKTTDKSDGRRRI